MTWVYLFFAAQLFASGYAGARGAAPERWVAAMLALAAAATALTPYDPRLGYRTVFWDVLWVDLSLLIGLTIIALFADRFWPMWVSALHFLAIATHAVRAIEPGLLPYAYWLVVGKIAYPMMLLLVMGAARHRGRLRAGLPEYGWTFQRHADERRSGREARGGRR